MLCCRLTQHLKFCTSNVTFSDQTDWISNPPSILVHSTPATNLEIDFPAIPPHLFSALHNPTQDTHRRSSLSSGSANFAYTYTSKPQKWQCVRRRLYQHPSRQSLSLFALCPSPSHLGVVCVYQMSLWHERKLTRLAAETVGRVYFIVSDLSGIVFSVETRELKRAGLFEWIHVRASSCLRMTSFKTIMRSVFQRFCFVEKHCFPSSKCELLKFAFEEYVNPCDALSISDVNRRVVWIIQ